MDNKDDIDSITFVDPDLQIDPPAPGKAKGKRPTKKQIAKNKKGNRGAIGRPKGDAAIMNEYRARMLTSPKSKHILTKIMDAALDDDHKHQAVAWKLVTERVLPITLFDPKRAKAAGGVNITITTAEGNSVSIGESDSEAIDGVYDEVEVDESDSR